MLDAKLDTLAIEQVEFNGSHFFSDTKAVSQGALVRIAGHTAVDGAVTTLSVRIWNSTDSTGAPNQKGIVTFSEKAAIARVEDAASAPQLQVDSISSGTLPYMNGYTVFLELIRRRASKLTGRTVTVPLTWLFTTGRHDLATVTTANDSVRVSFADVTFTGAVDHRGWIINGKDSDGNLLRSLDCARF